MDYPIGEVLSGLTLTEEIGKGAYGTVYKSTGPAGTFAVKMLRELEQNSSEKVLTQFRREAAALASIEDPGIVRVFELGQHTQNLYIVMELVEGFTIEQKLRETPFSFDEVLTIAKNITQSLCVIHQKGLLHRDIKPSNIFLTQRLQTKLIDFGFAGRTGEVEGESGFIGTFLYSAPEQTGMLKRPVDERADLYALGCVLFECLCSRPPYLADNVSELLQAHAIAPVPKVRSFLPNCPERLALGIEMLMAKDPDDRFASAAHFLELLHAPEDKWKGILHPRLFVQSYAHPLPYLQEERERILRCLEALSHKNGGIFVVEGESGSGKGTLTRQIATEARKLDLPVLSGSCSPNSQIPLALFREAIASVIQSIHRSKKTRMYQELKKLQKAAVGLAPLLVRFSPELAMVLKDSKESYSVDELQDQFYSAIVEFLLGWAQECNGLLLILENVQWLDEGSAFLLQQLLPELQRSKILLLMTAEVSTAASALQTPVLVQSQALFQEPLCLQPLEVSDVSIFVHHYLGGEPLERHFIEELASACRGNPSVMVSYLRTLVDGGLLWPSWGSWSIAYDKLKSLKLPTDLLGMLDKKFLSLTKSTQALLVKASLFQRPFSLELLSIFSGGSEQDMLDMLEEATDLHLLRKLERHSLFDFYQNQFRAYLEQKLTGSEKKAYHQVIAQGMEQMEEDSDEYYFALTQHYIEGKASETPLQAYLACYQTAKRLALRFSHEDSHRYFCLAKEYAELAGETLDGLFFESYGNICVKTARVKEAQACYEQALQTVTGQTRRTYMHVRLAQALVANLDIAQAWETIQKGFKELGRPYPKGFLRRLGGIVWDWGRFFIAKRLGIGFGSAKGKAKEVHQALCALYETTALMGYFANDTFLMVQMALRPMYHAHRLGRSYELVSTYSLYAAFLGILGFEKFADRSALEGIQISEQMKERRVQAMASVHRGWAANLSGNVLRGYALGTSYLAQHEKWMDIIHYLNACGDLAWNTAVRGYYKESLEWVEKGVLRSEQTTSRGETIKGYTLYPHAGALYAIFGREQEAREHMELGRELVQAAPEDLFRKGAYVQYHLLYSIAIGDFSLDNLQLGEKTLRELKFSILETPFHVKKIYIYDCYLHMESCLEASDEVLPERLARLKKRLRVTRFAAHVPITQCHYLCVKAAFLGMVGKYKASMAGFHKAEESARKLDCPLVLYYVAKYRAFIHLRQGISHAADWDIRIAYQIAHSHGWVSSLRKLKALFSKELGTTSMMSQQTGTSDGLRRSQSLYTSSRLTHSQSTLLSVREHQGKQSTVQTGERREEVITTVTLKRYLDALLEMNLASSKIFEPNVVARVALDKILAILQAERAFLFRWNEGEGALEWMSGCDRRGEVLSEIKGHSSTVIEEVARTKEPVLINGIHEGASLGSESVIVHDLRSILAVPIQIKERFLGVVYADNRLAEGFFTNEDVSILLAIANHIGVSLEASQSAYELKIARDKALEANELKDQFLANMSHELRTPLNAIIGYSEMIADEIAGSGLVEASQDIQRVRFAAKHLLRLINAILQLTQLEKEHLGLDLHPIHLRHFCLQLMEAQEEEAKKNGNTLSLHCPEELGKIYTIQDYLKQLLLAILDNANKFTKDGHIECQVDFVVSEGGNEELVFAIKDTGIGIEEGTLPNIFDFFFQADMRSTRRYGGLGLGLALSERLATLLHGTIEVESEPKAGSTFTIRITLFRRVNEP